MSTTIIQNSYSAQTKSRINVPGADNRWHRWPSLLRDEVAMHRPPMASLALASRMAEREEAKELKKVVDCCCFVSGSLLRLDVFLKK